MRHRFWLLCAASGVVGLAMGGIYQVGRAQRAVLPPGLRPLPASVPADLAEFTPEERTNITVYERVNRGVVHIVTQEARRDFFFDVVPAEGSGSGSVLDHRGHILTNYHVIKDAQQIRVALFDGTSYSASLVGQDPSNDVAVLHIDAPPASLHPIPLGDSSKLRVGQKVYAIGNPFGLERTLTVGIISSLNRTLSALNHRTMKSIVQIDAAINPGNSGGPLLDSHSRLIGMNTAIASRTGQNAGVGFAIPVNTIKRVVPQLIEKGHVTRPDLGIAKVYQTEAGLLIAALAPGGPAERAGLRGFRIIRKQVRRGPFIVQETRIDQSAADLIVGIDGKRIHTVDDLLDAIEQKQPGQQVVVNVVRGTKQVGVPVTLGTSE